jgi:hypothetical protein
MVLITLFACTCNDKFSLTCFSWLCPNFGCFPIIILVHLLQWLDKITVAVHALVFLHSHLGAGVVVVYLVSFCCVKSLNTYLLVFLFLFIQTPQYSSSTFCLKKIIFWIDLFGKSTWVLSTCPLNKKVSRAPVAHNVFGCFGYCHTVY